MDENIPNPDGSSERRIQFDAPPPMVIDPESNYVAEMVTTAGTMKIALNSKRAPMTVNNFVFLARWHYYDGIIFHRVIREDSHDNIYHHFGIYLYKYSALKKFVNLKKSKNEIKERLEQLRAIDNNMKIDVLLANYFSSGIDTKKDLEEYINLLNK